MSKYSAELKATFSPSNSAVFTLGSLVVSAVLCCIGAYLFYLESIAGAVSLTAIGATGMVASFYLGFKSQRDQDLAAAKPFEFKHNDDGSFELSADTRTNQQMMLDILAASADMIRARRPLPEPAGKINENGDPDAGLSVKARSEVAKINEEIENDLNNLECALSLNTGKDQTLRKSTINPVGVESGEES